MDKWFHKTGSNLRMSPSKSVWKRVETRLDRKKRLTITRVWPIAAGLLILLSAALYYSIETNASAVTRNVAISEIELESYPTAYYDEMADWRKYLQKTQMTSNYPPFKKPFKDAVDSKN